MSDGRNQWAAAFLICGAVVFFEGTPNPAAFRWLKMEMMSAKTAFRKHLCINMRFLGANG
jgi:hypothetical protein